MSSDANAEHDRNELNEAREAAHSAESVARVYEEALFLLGWDPELEDARDFARMYKQTFEALTENARDALDTIDAKRKAGDFDHWESFTMGDLGAAIGDAERYFPSNPDDVKGTT